MNHLKQPFSMKTNFFALALFVASSLAGSVTLYGADDLFRLSWHGTAYSQDPVTGRMVARSFSEKQFIQQKAADDGVDGRGWVFVYRANKHDTAIVRASDGMMISDVIQMEVNFTDVSNPTQTQIARQAFLYDEAHSAPLGSAFGSIRQSVDKNGNLGSFSFKGSFNYTVDGTIYVGTFSTGARVKDIWSTVQ
jgi:hypothetical protein